ncbi:MAG: hypothetical protein FJX36_01820 [Alphaproteobacteria bacterium]|nr:hypothetical protein [Alphaproteobacteria bacterium]
MAALIVTMGSARADLAPDATALEAAVYAYGIAEYCGLVDQAVYDGFAREVRAIVAAEGLSDDEVKSQRYNGALALEYEIGDRGLGGYRPWCREDGVAAAERFRAVTTP